MDAPLKGAGDWTHAGRMIYRRRGGAVGGGGDALSAGRWTEARAGFEAALEIEESGEALFGLALSLWWLRDPVNSVRLQERAFGLFRRAENNENAFFTAMYLCLGYDMTFGNFSASTALRSRNAFPRRPHSHRSRARPLHRGGLRQRNRPPGPAYGADAVRFVWRVARSRTKREAATRKARPVIGTP